MASSTKTFGARPWNVHSDSLCGRLADQTCTELVHFEGRGHLIFPAQAFDWASRKGANLCQIRETNWRRGRDLNPRYGSPYT
jgi:hypothetical protein